MEAALSGGSSASNAPAPTSGPPLPRLVFAADVPQGGGPEDPSLVVLAEHEQATCLQTMEVAFAFASQTDPALLVASLARTLCHFPEVSGRFVKRKVEVDGLPSPETRRCILCNNHGVGFSYSRREGKLPDMVGPLAESYFDRAVGTRPMTDGSCGGPLLRVRCMDFSDNSQLLALSAVRALGDGRSWATFLKVWCHLARGEPEPQHLAAAGSRTLFEAALRGEPGYRVETSYSLLHRSRPREDDEAAGKRPHGDGENEDRGGAALPKLTLASFFVSAEEIEKDIETLSDACRKKRLIFDSETLSPDEVLFSLLCTFFVGTVAASMYMDLRACFCMESLFGFGAGLVDLDLSTNRVEAAGSLRRLAKPALQRDFWAWKRWQPLEGPSANVLFSSSWLSPFACLESFDFGAGACEGITTGGTLWQQYAELEARSFGPGAGAGFAMLLPQRGGVQVQAFLPKKVANRIANSRPCGPTWHAS